MTIKSVIRQHNVNIQWFEHDMVLIRQGRHGAWLIDTPLQMVSLTTDSPQRNATVIAWPSVSESILRVRLGITVFCILTLPSVTLGVTAKEVNVATIMHTDSTQVCLVWCMKLKEIEINRKGYE